MMAAIRPHLALLHSDNKGAHLALKNHMTAAELRPVCSSQNKPQRRWDSVKKRPHTEIKKRWVGCKECIQVGDALESLRGGKARRDNGLLKKASCLRYPSEGETLFGLQKNTALPGASMEI